MVNKSGNSKEYIWGKKKSKKLIIIIVSAVVVVAGVLGYIIFGFDSKTDTNTDISVNKAPQGDLARRSIDGVYVPVDESNRYPTAIMIENLTVARPQSNLSKANVVYEALAEGGITRFMAIYAGDTNIYEVGPIRSARPYYVDWAEEYGAMYMHAGGSQQALADIRNSDSIVDLDQFFNSQYYWRDHDRPVAIEHTLYSEGKLIQFALRDNNVDSEGDYETWEFKDDAVLADRPIEEKNITIDFSSFSYKVDYKYDKATNDYLRYQAGDIHKDKDEAEVRVKNIIVQKINTYLVDDKRLGMDTVGDGEAIVFVDGEAIVGTWEKKSEDARTYFYDAEGNEVRLNAGTIWVEAVPTDREIIYN
ncbi:MAG: DUF3048 domain-containing protein [bacterium]|nr:DUF3048 domain-containing protein [bacterium]